MILLVVLEFGLSDGCILVGKLVVVMYCVKFCCVLKLLVFFLNLSVIIDSLNSDIEWNDCIFGMLVSVFLIGIVICCLILVVLWFGYCVMVCIDSGVMFGYVCSGSL